MYRINIVLLKVLDVGVFSCSTNSCLYCPSKQWLGQIEIRISEPFQGTRVLFSSSIKFRRKPIGNYWRNMNVWSADELCVNHWDVMWMVYTKKCVQWCPQHFQYKCIEADSVFRTFPFGKRATKRQMRSAAGFPTNSTIPHEISGKKTIWSRE